MSNRKLSAFESQLIKAARAAKIKSKDLQRYFGVSKKTILDHINREEQTADCRRRGLFE